MFNLLVSGNSERWETPPYTSTIDRFKEYSGIEAEAIDLPRPETSRRLEERPALLMYEVGAGGPHARVVRHGRIRNIVRRARELAFTFEPDPDHAYLDRAEVLRIADQLGIAQFEQHIPSSSGVCLLPARSPAEVPILPTPPFQGYCERSLFP